MAAARSRSLTLRISTPMAILRRILDLLLDGIKFFRGQFFLAKKRQNQFTRRAAEELRQQVMNRLLRHGVAINPGRENKSAPFFAGGKIAFRLQDSHERENGGVGVLSV